MVLPRELTQVGFCLLHAQKLTEVRYWYVKSDCCVSLMKISRLGFWFELEYDPSSCHPFTPFCASLFILSSIRIWFSGSQFSLLWLTLHPFLWRSPVIPFGASPPPMSIQLALWENSLVPFPSSFPFTTLLSLFINYYSWWSLPQDAVFEVLFLPR